MPALKAGQEVLGLISVKRRTANGVVHSCSSGLVGDTGALRLLRADESAGQDQYAERGELTLGMTPLGRQG